MKIKTFVATQVAHLNNGQSFLVLRNPETDLGKPLTPKRLDKIKKAAHTLNAMAVYDAVDNTLVIVKVHPNS